MTGKRRKKQASAQIKIELLEPRLLFSADLLPVTEIDLAIDRTESFALPAADGGVLSLQATDTLPHQSISPSADNYALPLDQLLAEEWAQLPAVSTDPFETIESDRRDNVYVVTDLLDLQQIQSTAAPLASWQAVFIDQTVQQPQTLIDGLVSDDKTMWIVIQISSDTDGVDQITAALSQLEDINAIHLISHGEDHGLRLGNAALTADTIDRYATQIASWSEALEPNADLLLYGCDLAGSADGLLLLDQLASLAPWGIAASDDPTGHKLRGGDWQLEYRIGDIETQIAFDQQLINDWQNTLGLNAQGSEVQVNDVTTNAQLSNPEGGGNVAINDSGITVIVWEDHRSGTAQIFAKVYAADGTVLIPEFQVSDVEADNQTTPKTGIADNGNFAIVWTDADVTNEVKLRLYDASGAAIGTQQLVSDETGSQQYADTGFASDGSFLVTYESSDDNNIYVKRYAADGTAAGNAYVVNETTTGIQTKPSIAVNDNGSYIVTWSSDHEMDGLGVYMRLFDVNDVAVISEDFINQQKTGEQSYSSVASDSNGNFVVAWATDQNDIYARLFHNSSNEILKADVLVNTNTVNLQSQPDVDMDDAGEFVVSWTSLNEDGDGTGIYAQAFDTMGNKKGPPVQVATSTAGNQLDSSVAFERSDIIVSWSGAGATDTDGIYFQRYANTNTAPYFLTPYITAESDTLAAVPDASAIRAADLDGDGDTDLVSGTSAGQLYWHENTGDGTFNSAVQIADAQNITAIEVHDLDGDGDTDIVAMNDDPATAADSIYVLHNTYDSTSTVTFNTTTFEGSGVGESNHGQHVAIGDIDGDGNADIVATFGYAIGNSQLAVFEQNTPGTWTRTFLDNMAKAEGVDLADINGDGNLDIITSEMQYDLRWYQNDGNATAGFTTHKIVEARFLGTFDVAAADLDGDNDQDIAFVLGGHNGAVVWLENDGSAVPEFTPHQIYHHYTNGKLEQIEVADTNSDGTPDLIVTERYGDDITVHENDGFGVFTNVSLNSTVDGPTGIDVADIDGDGSKDIVFSATDGNAIGVNLNRGNNTFVNGTIDEDGYLPFRLEPKDNDAWSEQVELTINVTNGAISLNQGGLTVLSGAIGSASVVLEGTISDMYTALFNPNFIPDADFSGTGEVEITINDRGNSGVGGALSATETLYIDVNPVNDVPVLSDTNGSLQVDEGSSAFVFSAETATDIDSVDFDGGTLTIDVTSTPDASNYSLSLLGSATVSGGDVIVDGMVVGTQTGHAGIGPLIVSFNANATPTRVESVYQAVSISNDSQVAGIRNVTAVVTDGDGGTSNVSSEDVNFIAINDAPLLTAAPGGSTYTENDAGTVFDNALTLSDPDSTFDGGVLTTAIATNADAAGTDRLTVLDSSSVGLAGQNISFDDGSGGGPVLVASITPGSGVNTVPLEITFNAAATPAIVQEVARQVAFLSVSENPDTTQRALTMQVTVGDGGASAVVTRSMDVIEVNDAPVIGDTSPPVDTFAEDTEVEITYAELAALANPLDIDGTVAAFVITQDQLVYVDATGRVHSGGLALTIGADSSTASPWASGSNDVLSPGINAYWTPHQDSYGTFPVFEFSAIDDRGLQSIPTYANVSVTPVNDAPGSLVSFQSQTPDPAHEDDEIQFPFILGQDIEDSLVQTVKVKTVLSGSLKIGADEVTALPWSAGSNDTIHFFQGQRAFWTPDANANGTIAVFEAVFVDSGGLESETFTRNTTLVAVDDPPYINSNVVNSTYTENSPGTYFDNALSISDIDSPFDASVLTVAVSSNADTAGTDRLIVRNGGGVAVTGPNVTYDDGSGAGPVVVASLTANSGIGFTPLEITFNASANPAIVDAVARQVAFISVSENPDNAQRQLTMRATDSGGIYAEAVQSVDVIRVNDAPTLTNFAAPLASTDEDTAVEISFPDLDTGGDAIDVDGTIASFVVTNVPDGTLRIGSNALSATAWASGINDSIDVSQSAFWTPDANVNGELPVLELVAVDNDGAVSAGTAVAIVSVAPVNDAPVMPAGTTSFNPTDENTVSGAVSVAEILSSQAAYDIDDGAQYGIAVERVTANSQWEYSLDGATWTEFGVAVPTNALLLTDATLIRYQPDGIDGETAQFTFRAWDQTSGSSSVNGNPVYSDVTGGGGGTLAYSAQIATGEILVTPVNTPPLLSVDATPLTSSENSLPVFVAAAASITDADHTHLQSATVVIDQNYVAGEDFLAFTVSAGIAGVWDANRGTLQLTGNATRADYESVIRSITYVNTSENPSTQQRQLGISVSDGVDSSAVAIRKINIISVNDYPAGADKTISLPEDSVHSLELSDFGFHDAEDADPTAIQITQLPGRGTLTNGGMPVALGDTVSIPDIVTGKLNYTPAMNFSGIAGFEFKVKDTEDFSVAPNTITYNITQVNDAPTGSDRIIGLLEDTVYQFSETDFGFADSDNNNFNSIAIAAIPASGSLLYNGEPTETGDSIQLQGINAGQLRYVPEANANGTDVVSIEFFVQDDGGGTNTANNPNTLTIDITAVNDAPTATNNIRVIPEDTHYVLVRSDFDFSDTDNHQLNGIEITRLPEHGTLSVAGRSIEQGTFVHAAEIDALSVRFTPDAHYAGQTEFGFLVKDDGGTANGGADTALTANTFTFDVLPVNDTPQSADVTFTLLEDETLTLSPRAFTFFDADENDTLNSISIVSLPTQGTLQLSGDVIDTTDPISFPDIRSGELRYQPFDDGHGTEYDQFTFSVSDGQTGSQPHDANIDVLSVNDPPDGTDTTITLSEDTAYVFSRSDFGFSDTDGNAFSGIQISTPPINGALLFDNDQLPSDATISSLDIAAGKLSYAPAENENGLAYDRIPFYVQDNGGTDNDGQSTAMQPNFITIDVTAVDDPPLFNIPTEVPSLEVGNLITSALINVVDIDSSMSDLTLTLVTTPDTGDLSLDGQQLVDGSQFTMQQVLDGSLIYLSSDADTDSFEVLLSDRNNHAAVTASIVFNPTAPTPPQISNDTVVVPFGEVFDSRTKEYFTQGVRSLIQNDAFIPDDYTITVQSPPSHGQLQLNDDGTFIYQHDAAGELSDEFSYQVTDPSGQFSVAKVIIAVEPPQGYLLPEAPVVTTNVYDTAWSGAPLETISEKVYQSSIAGSVTTNGAATQPTAEEFTGYSQWNENPNPQAASVAFQLPEYQQPDNLTGPSPGKNIAFLAVTTNHERSAAGNQPEATVLFPDTNSPLDDPVRHADSKPGYHTRVSNPAFQSALSELTDDLDQTDGAQTKSYNLGVQTAFGVSFGLTAGIVSWLLRGGTLVASVLAATPLWTHIDPMRLISLSQTGQNADDSDDKVEKLFDRDDAY